MSILVSFHSPICITSYLFILNMLPFHTRPKYYIYFGPLAKFVCIVSCVLAISHCLQTGSCNCLHSLAYHSYIIGKVFVPILILETPLSTIFHSDYMSFTTFIISFPPKYPSIQFLIFPLNPPLFSSFYSSLEGGT